MRPTMRLSLTACTLLVAHSALAFGSKPPATDPAPTPTQAPAPTPSDKPQIINGWLDEYSQHIESTVASKYARLLDLPEWRMRTFCPSWPELNKASRRKFWSSLLWSMAGPESTRNRTLIYLEDTMDTDPVTGYQVRSEGLLQLSYQDVGNYGYKGGDISWSKDRTMAKADYDARKKYGNPARTILNAYANLNMGMFIIDKQLHTFNPNVNLEDALGKYWYVMKSNRAPFKEVLSNMKSRMPACF